MEWDEDNNRPVSQDEMDLDNTLQEMDGLSWVDMSVITDKSDNRPSQGFEPNQVEFDLKSADSCSTFGTMCHNDQHNSKSVADIIKDSQPSDVLNLKSARDTVSLASGD